VSCMRAAPRSVVTNHRTDRRELERWRRETLGNWCSEVCTATIGTRDHYDRARISKAEEVINSAMNDADRGTSELMTISYKFRFFGSEELFAAVQELFENANSMLEPLKKIHAADPAEDADASAQAFDEFCAANLGLAESYRDFIAVATTALNAATE
jgi:NADH dehydrogenase/NADH:ubiquinone oxidoreductase subunit G